MAAYVCYRSCCRRLLQQVSRSFTTDAHSSGVGQPSPLLSRLSSGQRLSSPLLSISQISRFYHGSIGAGRNARLPKGVGGSNGMFWRGFRSRRPDTKNLVLENQSAKQPSLLRPLAFTVFVCGASFTGCMVWQYEALRHRAETVMKGLDRQFNKMLEPNYPKQMGYRAHLNAMWNNLSDGQKLVAAVIGVNCLVFLCWKAPVMQPFLMKYFASMPGNPSVSMLLSAFSHFNLWHIGANMYVLWSFANVSVNLFGREQWLAVYLSSATISSFASLANKVLRGGAVVPSIGASGAIMCLLGAVCVAHPDARLSIAFIGEIYPHSFSASTALKFILLMDTAGLIMGWRMFDHAAHLGGVLFGMWYATYGHRVVWSQRESVMRWWHSVRGKPSK